MVKEQAHSLASALNDWAKEGGVLADRVDIELVNILKSGLHRAGGLGRVEELPAPEVEVVAEDGRLKTQHFRDPLWLALLAEGLDCYSLVVPVHLPNFCLEVVLESDADHSDLREHAELHELSIMGEGDSGEVALNKRTVEEVTIPEDDEGRAVGVVVLEEADEVIEL